MKYAIDTKINAVNFKRIRPGETERLVTDADTTRRTRVECISLGVPLTSAYYFSIISVLLWGHKRHFISHCISFVLLKITTPAKVTTLDESFNRQHTFVLYIHIVELLRLYCTVNE